VKLMENKMFPTPCAGGQTGSNARKAFAKREKMWRTPSATECMRGIGKKTIEEKKAQNIQISLSAEVGGQLNPNWVEWLMGFQIGWTELNVSETQSYLKLRKSLREQSKNLHKCGE